MGYFLTFELIYYNFSLVNHRQFTKPSHYNMVTQICPIIPILFSILSALYYSHTYRPLPYWCISSTNIHGNCTAPGPTKSMMVNVFIVFDWSQGNLWMLATEIKTVTKINVSEWWSYKQWLILITHDQSVDDNQTVIVVV